MIFMKFQQFASIFATIIIHPKKTKQKQTNKNGLIKCVLLVSFFFCFVADRFLCRRFEVGMRHKDMDERVHEFQSKESENGLSSGNLEFVLKSRQLNMSVSTPRAHTRAA